MIIKVYGAKDCDIIKCRGIVVCDNNESPIFAAVHEKSDVLFVAPPGTPEFYSILERLGVKSKTQFVFVDEHATRNDSGKIITK